MKFTSLTARELLESLTGEVLGQNNQPMDDFRIPKAIGQVQKRPDMKRPKLKKCRKYYQRKYRKMNENNEQPLKSSDDLKRKYLFVTKDEQGDTVKICQVDGDFVRIHMFSKFQDTAHHYLNGDFVIIPENEIWIDGSRLEDLLNKEEHLFQFYQRTLMKIHKMDEIQATPTARLKLTDHKKLDSEEIL